MTGPPAIEEQTRLAKQELARRELARRRLMAFTWYTDRAYQITPAHQMMADYLEQVESYITSGGETGIGRLMIFMPPRHGKSRVVSGSFPAWFLGRNPDRRVVLASYGAALASQFGRQVRNLIEDSAWQAVFGTRSGLPQPVQISRESRAVDNWNLEGFRGGMIAVGVGGALTGRGADLLVIDDPVKDRIEVESKTRREALWDWYTSTAYTRLEKGGAIVLMHTRWHTDDLAGRLLRRMMEEEGADRWTVLNLPATAEDWAEAVEPDNVVQALREGWWMSVDPLGREPGAALWPQKFNPETLDRIRANIGGYEWDALYQQRPRPVEGALIKAHQIIRIRRDEVPEGLTRCRYWDLAVSGREEADYIVGALVGRSKKGALYIINIARFPGPWADARREMVQVMLADPPEVEQGIEVVGQQAGYYQELTRDEALQGRIVRAVNPSRQGNKEVRANVWGSRIPEGLIYMVIAPWNDDFVSEAIAFPRGRYDDQVDGVSGAVQMLGERFLEPPEAVNNPFYG
ncbi:MAG: phage terminase large subunit [Anaerolineae bacterium]